MGEKDKKYNKERVIKENEIHKEDVMKAVSLANTFLSYQGEHHDDDKNIPEKAEILATALNTKDFTRWNEIHCMKKSHHYQYFFGEGKEKTTLFDLVECACDCVAANMRRTGELRSLEEEIETFERQGFDEFLARVMANTFIMLQENLRLE